VVVVVVASSHSEEGEEIHDHGSEGRRKEEGPDWVNGDEVEDEEGI
jgi:hypothetical protein